MSFETIALPSPSPGIKQSLVVHRFGPSGGQKVYIQAGLHADEHPGLLVAQHLLKHLEHFDAQGALNAEFVIVPFANPIGMRQRVFGPVTGRADLLTGQNFNRGMSITRESIDGALKMELQRTPEENDNAFRLWLIETVNSRQPTLEIGTLHKTLLSLSIDAHFVFDLHCDDSALPHVFYGNHQTMNGQLLAACMAADVCLEEDVTGTVAFDGSHTQPWVLAEKELAVTFNQPCFAATVELRGQVDVNAELAEQDALGLLTFCAEKGLIENFEKTAKSLPKKIIGVDQVKIVSASHAGIVTYHCALHDEVKQGDKLASIVLLDQPSYTEVDVLAPSDGFVFSQTHHYLVYLGQTIVMLATQEQQLKTGTQLAF